MPASATADALDLPAQIGTSEPDGMPAISSEQIGRTDRSVAAPSIPAEQITLQDKTKIEEIGGAVDDATQAEQTVGGRDLCGPDVSAATRKRLGVDCGAPVRARTGGDMDARVGTRTDPLLTPRDRDAQQQFEELGLGDDVPATVILQQ
ncbi:MAG: hypothetical protein AAF416_07700 [Pseudomonadota bacterium]